MIWVLQEPRRPVADGVATIGREKSFSANARNAAGWFGQGSELLGGSPGMFVTDGSRSRHATTPHSATTTPSGRIPRRVIGVPRWCACPSTLGRHGAEGGR